MFINHQSWFKPEMKNFLSRIMTMNLIIFIHFYTHIFLSNRILLLILIFKLSHFQILIFLMYIYVKEVQWKRNAQKHFLYNISMENNEGGEEEANDERRSPLRASEEIAYQEFYLQNEILRDCFIRYPLFHGII